MKKILISLVAVVGLFVVDCSAKEVLICKSNNYDHDAEKKVNPYFQELTCYGKGNAIDNEGSKLSFDKIYSNGWHFVGQFKANGLEPVPTYIVFEK